MADSVMRNSGMTHRFNSSVVCIQTCSSDGTGGTDWLILPFSSGEKISRTGDSSELKDGANAVIARDSTLSGYTLSADLLQANADVFKLLNGSTGEYYHVYFNQGRINGKQVDWILGICQMDSAYDTDFSDWNKVPIKFTTLKNAKVVTITGPSASGYAWEAATAVTIAIDAHILVSENTP